MRLTFTNYKLWVRQRKHFLFMCIVMKNLLPSALAQGSESRISSVIVSVTRTKGPRRFCPHRSDHCRALMLTCRNSPLWQCCECCNNVWSLFWPSRLARTWSIERRDHHVTYALIGTMRKLAAYNYTSCLASEWRLRRASGCKRSLPKYPKGRVESATRSVVATC